jgi:hypothetical protein
MSLDATRPADTDLATTIASYLRETRTSVNTLVAAVAALGGAPAFQTAALLAGATSFDIDAGLITIVSLSAAAGVSITDIDDGVEGQIALIRTSDANITLIHNNSKIDLNGGVDKVMAAGDWIMLVNFGSDLWIEAMSTTWT